jgi:hypothetical protein
MSFKGRTSKICLPKLVSGNVYDACKISLEHLETIFYVGRSRQRPHHKSFVTGICLGHEDDAWRFSERDLERFFVETISGSNLRKFCKMCE